MEEGDVFGEFSSSLSIRKEAIYAITDVDLVFLTREDSDIFFIDVMNSNE